MAILSVIYGLLLHTLLQRNIVFNDTAVWWMCADAFGFWPKWASHSAFRFLVSAPGIFQPYFSLQICSKWFRYKFTFSICFTFHTFHFALTFGIWLFVASERWTNIYSCNKHGRSEFQLPTLEFLQRAFFIRDFGQHLIFREPQMIGSW